MQYYILSWLGYYLFGYYLFLHLRMISDVFSRFSSTFRIFV